MSQPSFSIVIPTYERRELVTGALQSLAKLQYAGDWSVCVVVDGSTDDTAEALRALDLPYPLNIIEQDNAGLAAARNAGARHSEGDILLFLDDDMRVAPDLLGQHAAALEPSVVAVAGWIGLDEQSDAGFIAQGVGEWTEGALDGPNASDPFALYGGHFSVRRNAFEAIGGCEERYTSNGGYGREDTDLAVRLLNHGAIAAAPDARAWQVHNVAPDVMIKRAFEQGRADIHFCRTHPRHAAGLLSGSGASRALDQMVLQWVARIPGIRAASEWLAKILGGAKSFDIARRVHWWAGVQHAGGVPSSKRVLALCYHAIADHSDDPVLAPYSIPPPLFRDHIRSLVRRGFHFVTADTALAVARGLAQVPDRSVLLTFDDGYDDLPAAVNTLLAPHGIPALAFLVSGRLGETNVWDQPAGALPRQLVDWEGAAELRRSGVTLGSHSRFHADLSGLGQDDLRAEIDGPRQDFAAAGLPVPSHFAYPFGEKNAAAKQAVQDAGYAAGWGLADRRVTPASDLYDLPRVMMHSTDTLWRFRFKTRFPTAATILRHWPFVARR